jgi:hypothetical protein
VPVPTIFDLKVKPEHAIREKWDWVFPKDFDFVRLLARNYTCSEHGDWR